MVNRSPILVNKSGCQTGRRAVASVKWYVGGPAQTVNGNDFPIVDGNLEEKADSLIPASALEKTASPTIQEMMTDNGFPTTLELSPMIT